MYKALLILILGLLLKLTSPLSHAAENSTAALIYGYPDVSVWTTHRDQQGQLMNPLLKLAQVLFTKADIPWEGKAYPARRLFGYLREGVIPFAILVRASTLEQCCLFSQKPVTGTDLRIYHKSRTAAIDSLQDLAGKQVITIRGYSYGDLGRYLRDATNQVRINEAANHAAAFQLLERNRGDYVIDYAGPAQEVLSDHPIDDITSDFYKRLDVFLVLSRSYPNAAEVMKQLETIIDKLDVPAILHSR